MGWSDVICCSVQQTITVTVNWEEQYRGVSWISCMCIVQCVLCNSVRKTGNGYQPVSYIKHEGNFMFCVLNSMFYVIYIMFYIIDLMFYFFHFTFYVIIGLIFCVIKIMFYVTIVWFYVTIVWFYVTNITFYVINFSLTVLLVNDYFKFSECMRELKCFINKLKSS